ncbi:hypothetical protein [Bacillus sp. MUM 13]|uniref:hypothetical protein n=1 Tax=Bacillus sp. MUM 13 TaxID=1678001 RepID=UPI0008F5CCCB|nr:hypothetical protein [Bacillus sp. MUM 13]OIK08817.1 hypothetical protein BIV59_18710 [Bacillus sp. MUM 13]
MLEDMLTLYQTIKDQMKERKEKIKLEWRYDQIIKNSLKPYVNRIENYRENGEFEEYMDIDTLLELLEEGLNTQLRMIKNIEKSEIFNELDLSIRKELKFQEDLVLEKLHNIDDDDDMDVFDVKTDIEQILKLYNEKDKSTTFSK